MKTKSEKEVLKITHVVKYKYTYGIFKELAKLLLKYKTYFSEKYERGG